MATTKVTTNVIADDAVTTDKITDLNVTTAKIADDNVTYAKMQDTSTNNRVLGAATAGTIAEVQVATDMIADDAVSYEKVDAEFTTSTALSAGGTVDVNFDAAQVFTLTPNGNVTLNITNPKIGITKTVVITGSGTNNTLGFTVGGSSGTFNKIGGDYDDTSSTKNLVSITCVAATEFWYAINQIAS